MDVDEGGVKKREDTLSNILSNTKSCLYIFEY